MQRLRACPERAGLRLVDGNARGAGVTDDPSWRELVRQLRQRIRAVTRPHSTWSPLVLVSGSGDRTIHPVAG